MKIVWIMAVLAMVFVATAAFAQTKTKMETNKIEAKALRKLRRPSISGRLKEFV